jgi:hypothetical protein
VEVHFEDDQGRRRCYRRPLSTENPISEGEHAGCVWGAMDCHEPARYKHVAITARPLAAEELDLLDSRQLTLLLAGQQVAAMNVKSPSCGFAARSEVQQHAIEDPESTWFLRVATRKEAGP